MYAVVIVPVIVLASSFLLRTRVMFTDNSTSEIRKGDTGKLGYGVQVQVVDTRKQCEVR